MVKALFVSAVLTLCATEATASVVVDRALDPHHPDWPEAQISAEVRELRAERIRDTAAAAGMTNGVLLAGIGQVETGFAHCWSEATWACQGPASSTCDGGAVIAGAADGPCSDQQGGLGMFQFDSGTFTDTINTYGPDIVTIEGNVGAVVPFLVTRAIQSVEGVSTEQEALDWMNSIPVVEGDPLFEEWIYFVAWRYNGCKGCAAQQGKYRDGTLLMLDEMGADFWNVNLEDPCAPLTADGGILEEDDDCYRARGESEYWRTESGGHGGTLHWTKTTDSEEANNYAIWRLRFAVEGDYEILVYSDGGEFGQSTQAAYQVTHADGTDIVTIDQSSTDGWHSLGSFRFDEVSPQQVRLDDNTGEPWAADPGGVKLIFDALSVEPVGGTDDDGVEDGDEDEMPDAPGDVSGAFCSVSSQGLSGAWPLLLSLLALGRRRRR